ncbi:MAG: PIG-L deacetylase family protein [Elusimicrobiota bacterium]|nr:PIG-L deacetylase family protein [Elusimicrobiota bacterium]
MNKVLVIAVHPDDETLGCGGTLLKHLKTGDETHWLIATCMKKGKGFTAAEVSKRAGEIGKVRGLYGFKGVHQLGISTTTADTLPMSAIVSGLSSVIKKVRPDIVYLPFMCDPHSDHRILFQAACSCIKSFRYPFIRKALMMETLSETEFSPAVQNMAFVPNYFTDITPFFRKKLEIMRIYRSELSSHPFPRSERNIEALATLRGASSNCEYAEAFMLLKEIA